MMLLPSVSVTKCKWNLKIRITFIFWNAGCNKQCTQQRRIGSVPVWSAAVLRRGHSWQPGHSGTSESRKASKIIRYIQSFFELAFLWNKYVFSVNLWTYFSFNSYYLFRFKMPMCSPHFISMKDIIYIIIYRWPFGSPRQYTKLFIKH